MDKTNGHKYKLKVRKTLNGYSWEYEVSADTFDLLTKREEKVREYIENKIEPLNK